MADLKLNQLIARARAANKKTLTGQNLLSQEVKYPSKELIQATKREELRVPVKTPGKDLEKQIPKTVVIEIPANKDNLEPPPPPPKPEPAPSCLPSQEMLSELSLKVTLAIENSKLTAAKMTEATRIFEEVKLEIQKTVVDWVKVTGLLKKSLDYGLGIGLEIIKIAAIYYQAKVPACPPKKETKVIEIKPG
ncbi:MAG: hypothetical protein K6U80_09635 [Firmicutes bacterium]|nr:hypothetical protein [Bacillota bacterium]